MRWIASWWALIGLLVLWSLLFGSAVLQMFSTVQDSCRGQTDAATTWCEGWVGLLNNALLFGVVLAWLTGLIVVIVVWTAIRRRRGRGRARLPQKT
jgi:hypothetical protein